VVESTRFRRRARIVARGAGNADDQGRAGSARGQRTPPRAARAIIAGSLASESCRATPGNTPPGRDILQMALLVALVLAVALP